MNAHITRSVLYPIFY